MWQSISSDEAVERLGKLPEVAALGQTDEQLKDAATRLLRAWLYAGVYSGALLPKPGPTGIRPASEFSGKGPSLDATGEGPDRTVSGRWCGTRADGGDGEDDERA